MDNEYLVTWLVIEEKRDTNNYKGVCVTNNDIHLSNGGGIVLARTPEEAYGSQARALRKHFGNQARIDIQVHTVLKIPADQLVIGKREKLI